MDNKTLIDNVDSRELTDEGFSLLELVVAIGILLVLTVGGLIGYNSISQNAVKAATETAATDTLKAAVVFDTDGDDKTDIQDAADDWNETAGGEVDNKTIVVEVERGESPDEIITTATHNKKGYEVVRSNKGNNSTGNTGGGSDGSNDGEENEEPIIEPTANRSYEIQTMPAAFVSFNKSESYEITYKITNDNGDVLKEDSFIVKTEDNGTDHDGDDVYDFDSDGFNHTIEFYDSSDNRDYNIEMDFGSRVDNAKLTADSEFIVIDYSSISEIWDK